MAPCRLSCLFVFSSLSKKYKGENNSSLHVAAQCDHQGAATQCVASISMFLRIQESAVNLPQVCIKMPIKLNRIEKKVIIKNHNNELIKDLLLCYNYKHMIVCVCLCV